jgi:hypothetical protein
MGDSLTYSCVVKSAEAQDSLTEKSTSRQDLFNGNQENNGNIASGFWSY